jgi:hypothetical protein
MFDKVFQVKKFLSAFVLTGFCSVLLINGCAVEAVKNPVEIAKAVENPVVLNTAESSAPKATIKIQPNSPADTVRVFYQKMRERNFREALFLTNLRPAIEGLTETELKDLQVDFDALAGQIPAEIAINGEIVSNEEATVTAKLPDNETDELKLQEIKLRRENGVWVILTLDAEAEKVIKKEGNNYFFALKIETHQEEAKAMLERIFKAQLVYSAQNGGLYGDFAALIQNGFLPGDIKTADSTGYKYNIILPFDKKSYSASAEPAVYGKTGKLSYLLTVGGNQKSSIKSEDNKGKPVKN